MPIFLFIGLSALFTFQVFPQQMLTQSKSIVFIHGLFMTPDSWDNWVDYYQTKGYTCYTPAYPFHQGVPSELRTHIAPGLHTLDFKTVLLKLANFIDKLAEKPILIGHSMGGLFVQKLMEMDKGSVGICINSAPPKGVFVHRWSFLKSNFQIINPFKQNTAFAPGKKWFHYAFCNTMTRKESDSVYEKFAVPESRKIPQTSTKKRAIIDFNKPHAPLLFIAGTEDHLIPAILNQKNFNAYQHKGSKRFFKEFPGKTHFICGQPGWDNIVDYTYNWISN